MIKRILSTLIVLTMIFSVTMVGQTVFAAGEQAVLDKECTNAVSSFGVRFDRKICQIFTPGFTGNMDRISLYMDNEYCANSGQMTLVLKNTDGSGNPTGEPLATAGFAYAANTNAWYDTVFQNKPLLSEKNQYALILEGKGTDPSIIDYILQTGYSRYMGGNLTATGVNLGDNASLNYKTYMVRQAAPAIPVPPRNPSSQLDKYCDSSYSSFGIFIGNEIRQTFTAGKTGLLDEVEIFVSNKGQDIAGELTVEVTAAGNATGKVLASSSFEYAKLADGWYRAVFKQKPSVVAGQQYALNIKGKTFGIISGHPDFIWAMATGIDSRVGGGLSVTGRPMQTNQSMWFKTYILEGYAMPGAPVGLNGVAVTGTANNDGKITGVTAEMEYKLASASVWTLANSTEVTGLAAGTYAVRYVAKAGSLAGAEVEVTVNAYIPPPPALPVFKDVAAGAWYYDAVKYVAAQGITTGTSSDQFSPDRILTRGQFMVMVMKAYDIKADEKPTDNFVDAGNTYYTDYLGAAKRLGLSGGVGDNRFAPDLEITRAEMFTLLYNTLNQLGKLPSATSGKSLADFGDSSKIAPWAKEAMSLMVSSEVVSGSGGKLNPTGTATRAEMAQLLYKLLTK